MDALKESQQQLADARTQLENGYVQIDGGLTQIREGLGTLDAQERRSSPRSCRKSRGRQP